MKVQSVEKLKERFKSINRGRLSWVVAIEISAILVAASFFLPGCDDLLHYYLPYAKGCLDCAFTPYYSYWILWPLQFIPAAIIWPVWTAITLAGLLVICRFSRVNPILLLMTFPLHGQLWLGQVDVLICAGLALIFFSSSPYLRGAGIILALIKPQYTALAVLYLLTREKQLVKTLILPAAVILLSLVVFGAAWPIEWLKHGLSNLPPHHWRLAAADIWPLGAVLLWVPFLFKDRQPRFEVGTIISTLASPVVGVYCYVIFLVFSLKKWWVVPLSYLWILLEPLMGREAMRFAWVLPVGLLAYLVLVQYKKDLPPLRLRGLRASK
jgi:hypothetical protein